MATSSRYGARLMSLPGPGGSGRRLRGLVLLAALVVLAAACGPGTDTTASTTTMPQSEEDSKRRVCVAEHVVIVWAGQRLEEAAFSAIEQFTAGDTGAAQAAYDETARVANSLPELAFNFGERCRQYTPGLVEGMEEAVQIANDEWRRMREGCEKGPALEGFHC